MAGSLDISCTIKTNVRIQPGSRKKKSISLSGSEPVLSLFLCHRKRGKSGQHRATRFLTGRAGLAGGVAVWDVCTE